ncbi:MAG: cyclic nucleotide-binding domain-containing protein [Verrucomicrobiota bacterium]|nr:cyclic nucleotide-binding domain-containing protein [Verrucomicrobiota bacterium]
MPIIPERSAGLFVRDDDEGLFSRDLNGQLVRLDAPTQDDYQKQITLQIDGQSISVPLAEPLKDANGNVVQDMDGQTTPRYTTIYDAATKLYGDEAKVPIPTLCHLPHMKPVAVCRLCVVQIYGQKRGKRAAERKLLPACQHPVKDGMEVFTMNAAGPDGDRVRQSVKVVTELLAADCLKPAPQPWLAPQLEPFNELGQMVERSGANPERFKTNLLSKPPPTPRERAGRRKLDASSPVFTVDHSACVLCDRCVRACDDVMENHVIGRTGKGNTAGIGFDLNDAMGESTCVQCGECMVSCPTTAITFNPVATVKPRRRAGRAKILSAAELVRDPVFDGIPPKFLLWQQGLVVRRQLRAGEILCRKGEPGNTAFILKSGKLEAVVPLPGVRSSGGFLRFNRPPVFRAELTPEDLIVGEMACLSGSPRVADVTVLEDAEVWEVRRNVLDRLMRIPSRRAKFETEYRDRSLNLVLQGIELFRDLAYDQYNEIVEFLRKRITFLRVTPGQVLFRQGEPSTEVYLIRLGHVRVGVQRYNDEIRVLTRGPGTIFGEIGLLGLSARDAAKTADQIDHAIKTALEISGSDAADVIPAGARSATCSALNYLELARLGRADFLDMLRRFPVLRRRLVEQSLASLRSDSEVNPVMAEFVEQGLYEGQSILVLDMDLCTRCDECTKGCIREHGTESHGLPITRLLRDGRRFGDFLVATSCRSCTDPHCMSGCPVDSIHRGKHLQIVIEDHCIGCGLCASNCPYGNIFMVPNERRVVEVLDASRPRGTKRIAQLKAATCDLCDAEGNRSSPKPQCVASCPHEAASRLTGPELLQRVIERREERFGADAGRF